MTCFFCRKNKDDEIVCNITEKCTIQRKKNLKKKAISKIIVIIGEFSFPGLISGKTAY